MAISDKITSMTNHLTADYDAIESVVGEVTVDKNIENIAPLINNLYEELPKVTASGTELTINDTRAGKMKVQPMGNTSQTQKTGKNLLNIQTSSSSQFGITVTKNSDGTLTVNGTATADAAVIFNTSVTLSAGTYTLSGCPSGGSVNTYNLNLDQVSTMRDNGSGVTFTLNSERTSTAYVSVKSGVAMNNVIFKPMIVSGSTSGDFEPYTGKKATPNPDNPEQVHTCSGDNEVVVCGKNLFDKDIITTGKTYTSTGGISNLASSFVQETYISVLPNTAYTLSTTNDYSSIIPGEYRLVLCEYNSSKSFIQRNLGAYDTHNVFTITTTANTYYLRVCASNLTLDELQLEKGSTPTPYEPYQSSTYPIHLGTYELCKIGTYQDKFIRNSGKNLFDETYYSDTSLYGGGNRYFTSVKMPDSFKTKFYGNMILKGTSQNLVFGFSTTDQSVNTRMLSGGTITNNVEYDFTNATDVYLMIGNPSQVDILTDIPKIFNNYNIMISKTSGDTYEPYGNGDWYLEKHIGKVAVDGTEAWGRASLTTDVYYFAYGGFQVGQQTTTGKLIYCNYFKATNTWSERVVGMWFDQNMIAKTEGSLAGTQTLDEWKTWLSTHNLEVYYVLNTPTYTKIEGTLKDELEAVWRAYSYNEQTNITQSNNDLPFELSITALEG